MVDQAAPARGEIVFGGGGPPFCFKRWINCSALSRLGSAKRAGRVTPASARAKTACPYRCLAPQLAPSRTSSERTFEQCVSPSPAATTATAPCTLARRSRLPRPARWKKDNEQAWKDDWNGPSNTASRHRLRRPPRQGPASIANRSKRPIHLPYERENKQAWTDHWVLAIACGDPSDFALHLSQVAVGQPPPNEE
jgi:hypothetical protein